MRDRLVAAVAFTLLAVGLLWARESPLAPAFTLAGAVVACGLGLALVAARAALRDTAVRMIASGEDAVGVRELDDARDQLADPGFRSGLARSFTAFAVRKPPADRIGWRLLPPVAPGPDAAAEMRAIGDLLVQPEPSLTPRAVALCACLVTDGFHSPLFTGDQDALERELRRIRYHAL